MEEEINKLAGVSVGKILQLKKEMDNDECIWNFVEREGAVE